MSDSGHDPIMRLTLELGRLPGIGERTAQRLAYYVIKSSHNAGAKSLAHDLAKALVESVEQARFCSVCQNLTTADVCSICSDPRRDKTLVCVVEGVSDLRAVEASASYRGTYHVLHGSLSPLEGVGPDDLKLRELVARLSGPVTEIILATNADVEGDATALYIARLVKPHGVRVTRLASGIPMGGELEYVDQATLGRALSERRDF